MYTWSYAQINWDYKREQGNIYATYYKTLWELELHEVQHAQQEQKHTSVINLIFNKDCTADRRKYSLPTVNELAMLFSNTDNEQRLQDLL